MRKELLLVSVGLVLIVTGCPKKEEDDEKGGFWGSCVRG